MTYLPRKIYIGPKNACRHNRSEVPARGVRLPHTFQLNKTNTEQYKTSRSNSYLVFITTIVFRVFTCVNYFHSLTVKRLIERSRTTHIQQSQTFSSQAAR